VTNYVSVNPGSNLNLISAPSTHASIIGKLANGTKVDDLSDLTLRDALKINGKTGYVSAQYLKSNSGNNSGGGSTEKVIATKYVSVNPGSSLNLRNGPSTNATIIGKLANGTKVDVLSESNG